MTGTNAQVAAAKRLVLKACEASKAPPPVPPGEVRETLPVLILVERQVGRGGATISAIQSETGARLDLVDGADGCRIVRHHRQEGRGRRRLGRAKTAVENHRRSPRGPCAPRAGARGGRAAARASLAPGANDDAHGDAPGEDGAWAPGLAPAVTGGALLLQLAGKHDVGGCVCSTARMLLVFADERRRRGRRLRSSGRRAVDHHGAATEAELASDDGFRDHEDALVEVAAYPVGTRLASACRLAHRDWASIG